MKKIVFIFLLLTAVLYADENKSKNVNINIADGLLKVQVDGKDSQQDKNVKISIGGGIFELNVNDKNVEINNQQIDDVTINVGKGFGVFITIIVYIIAMILILFNLAFYLLPSIIAIIRKINKRDIFIITILNLLFGWTVVGWIIVLIWALISQKTGNKMD